MGDTKIEWATKGWNPVTGCTKVSVGCTHCYAERQAKRFLREGIRFGTHGPVTTVADDFTVLMHPDRLDQPLHWRKPRRVFVCSMGDLFHKDVPTSFIDSVYSKMACCLQHTFMILTKRPQRALQYCSAPELLPNVWLGVSVENQAAADERIPLLLQIPAPVRFVSVEPMLGPVDLRGWLTKPQWRKVNERGTQPYEIVGRADLLNWVICGGESGPGARSMHPEWARSLRDQCVDAGVPFFFKQWGEWAPGVPSDDVWCRRIYDWPDGVTSACRVGKRAAGRLLDGREWSEFPKQVVVAP